MLYPIPAVLVTTKGSEGRANVCTVAWAGTICSNPAMLSISLRPSRLSYTYVKETGVFGVNLTTRDLVFATDYCGVKSGRDVDKFEDLHLETEPGDKIDCPLLKASPVNLECRVKEEIPLGTHTMFLAEVEAVHVDDTYCDEKGSFELSQAHPIVYSHGAYLETGRCLGTFGFSVRKKAKAGAKRSGYHTRRRKSD